MPPLARFLGQLRRGGGGGSGKCGGGVVGLRVGPHPAESFDHEFATRAVVADPHDALRADGERQGGVESRPLNAGATARVNVYLPRRGGIIAGTPPRAARQGVGLCERPTTTSTTPPSPSHRTPFLYLPCQLRGIAPPCRQPPSVLAPSLTSSSWWVMASLTTVLMDCSLGCPSPPAHRYTSQACMFFASPDDVQVDAKSGLHESHPRPDEDPLCMT